MSMDHQSNRHEHARFVPGQFRKLIPGSAWETVKFLEMPCPVLHETAARIISWSERLARADNSPTRSGPEGSSRNELRSGRCPASHPLLIIFSGSFRARDGPSESVCPLA